MKIEKIIAFTGIYGNLILSNISTGEASSWFWMGLSFIFTIRYAYLELKH